MVFWYFLVYLRVLCYFLVYLRVFLYMFVYVNVLSQWAAGMGTWAPRRPATAPRRASSPPTPRATRSSASSAADGLLECSCLGVVGMVLEDAISVEI